MRTGDMNFEEFWKDVEEADKPDEYHDTNARFYAEAAWNAAIDEAVKVAKDGSCYTPTATAHNIERKIKELK